MDPSIRVPGSLKAACLKAGPQGDIDAMGAKMGGGGGGKFGLGQNADINVTPFVDVLLVLLIIFMLAIPLATVSIKLDLPPPDPNAPAPTKPPVFVNVQPGGKILIANEEVTLTNLDSELAKALGGPNPTQEHVAIKADRNVRYQDFMTVLNTLQYGGFLKIGLVTENLV
jgi:biopolymer transport protein ExbD